MNFKNGVIEYGAYTILIMGSFYLIFGKNSKYLNPISFVALPAIRKIGKEIKKLNQEDNAGGTTPYNPLKIPAKKTTPANII